MRESGAREATPGWKARTGVAAAALFLMMAAFVLGRTGRDALYISGGGLSDLPRAYLGIALLSLPVSALALSLMRWMGVRRGRVTITFAGAAGLLAYFFVARPGGGLLMTVCFTLLPLGFGVMFSVGWLFGAELLDQAPRGVLPRAYAWIGAASIAGGAVGGLSARMLAGRVFPETLFLVAAGALAGSSLVIVAGHNRCPFKRSAVASLPLRPIMSDLRRLMRERYIFRLLAVAMVAGLVGVLVEFQFFVVAASKQGGMQARTVFFADVYLTFNAVALALQLFVMARLQRRVGVNGSLLVLPCVLATGAVVLLGGISGAARAWLRVAEGSIKSSIQRSNWEQAYLPIARASRGTAKLMVDGAGARLAEGLAAGLIFGWLRFFVSDPGELLQSVRWVIWLLLAGTALWVVLARRLGSEIARCLVVHDSSSDLRLGSPLPDG